MKKEKEILEKHSKAEKKLFQISFLIIDFFSKIKREEQRLLAEKLAQIERKIIVGGENLLEKAEAQAKLLEDNEKLLEKQKERQAQLKKIIDEKEVI